MNDNVNILKLKLITSSNTLSSELDTSNIEWISSQGQYLIQIEASRDLDGLYVLLTTTEGVLKEFIKAYKKQDGNSIYYECESAIGPKLKGGSQINLGVMYSINEISYRTEPLRIKINEAIVDDGKLQTPENVEPENGTLVDLINTFSDAKALDRIEVISYSKIEKYDEKKDYSNYSSDKTIVIFDGNVPIDITNLENPYCLIAYYKNFNYPVFCGIVNISSSSLGIISTNTNSSLAGGGQVGNDAKTTIGFSGGKTSESTTGGAVGNNTKTTEGFAGGTGATSETGVAIGKDAKSTFNNVAIGDSASAVAEEGKENIENNIVIGNSAQSKNNNDTIVIGSNNKVETSNNSIRIGKEDTSDTTSFKASEDSIGIGTNIKSSENRNAVLIGSNINTSKLTYGSYVDGDKTVDTETAKLEPIHSNICIGDDAIATERSCIAIGPHSVAGCIRNTDPNEKDRPISRAYERCDISNEPASIAIGRRSAAYAHGGIAIGKECVAGRFSSVAIGYCAEAGPNFQEDNKSTPLFYSPDNGMKSIAIGYFAKAKADGAVQIGQGTNNIKNSLQFSYYGKNEKNQNAIINVPIVQNGYVQVDLNNGTKGVLPRDKGGTGATTKLGARRSLGIFTGSFQRTFDPNSFTGTGVDVKLTYSSRYTFNSAPNAFVNLRMATSDTTSPVLVNYYIKEITTKYILLRVDYWKKDWDSKKNSKWNWYFDCLVIGNGEYK